MGSLNRLFRARPLGFMIIAACVVIVLVLTASLLYVSFTSFKTGIDEAVHAQTRELSTQIVYNYANYIESIIDTSRIIQADIDLFDITAARGRGLFGDYLREMIRQKSDILKISVYDCDTGRCIASSTEAEVGTSAADANWYTSAAGDSDVHIFSVPYAVPAGEDYKVNVSKGIYFRGGDRSGILKIEISFQRFIELAEKSNLGAGGHITIIDRDYAVVYSSLGEITAAQAETDVLRSIVPGSQNTVLGRHHIAVNVDALADTQWRICVFINIDHSAALQQRFLATAAAVSLAVLAAGILLFSALARTVTRPMKQLELAMQKVEEADYFRMEEVRLAAPSEVEALVRRFNRMMHKIGELMEHVIAEQGAQRKSELKALQNQINPHFLYNTLDSLLWLIENNKNAEAGEMLVALARLFRIGISVDSEVISVRDEIEHVRNYLLIQAIRYADAFDYTFDIDPAALEHQTMKLILQPLVENCIYHGLKNKIDRGHIDIRVALEGDCLLLSVSDNGYGMRRETLDALRRSLEGEGIGNGVGLKNIYQRVRIYYGGHAEMTLESEPDEGTVITIREPLARP